MKSIPVLGTLALLACGNLAAQASEPVEWITDPAELAARGFDPDGPPIQRLIIEPDTRPLAERLAERELIETSVDVGGGDVRWASVQATDFMLLGDEAAYTTQGNFNFSCLAGAPTNLFADAPIHFRDDRRLRFFDVWTHDSSASGDVEVLLYRVCQPAFTAAAPVVTELASRSSTGSGGNQFSFVSIPGMVHSQNSICSYWVRTRFPNCTAGIDLKVLKARVVWD